MLRYFRASDMPGPGLVLQKNGEFLHIGQIIDISPAEEGASP
jgi:hypothetical protein